jgi:hypothetical protein
VLTHRCVDTSDPQLAENAFFGATIAIGVLPRFHHRFFGDAEYIAPAAAETLGCG